MSSRLRITRINRKKVLDEIEKTEETKKQASKKKTAKKKTAKKT